MTAPAPRRPRRAVVVGAGLAGLAAAEALLEAGVETVLVERGRVGGRSVSYPEPTTGRTVDNSQHIILGCCDSLAAMWRRHGVPVAWHDRYVFAEPLGRRSTLAAAPLPAPVHLAPSLLGLRFLSWTERAALARGLARARRDAASSALDGATFAAWLDEAAQPPRAVGRFWRLVAVSALNAEPAEVSAAAALRVFRGAFLDSRGGYRMGIPRRPLADVHEATLAHLGRRPGGGLRFHAGTVAEAAPGGVRLADGESIEAEAVVVAVPAWEAGRILPPALAAALDLGAFRPAPIAAVHLWYEGRLGLPPFAALLDSDVHWVFDKTENWGLGGDETYLSCVVSAARAFVERGREAAIEAAAEAVARAFPEVRRARRLAAGVTAEARATFVPAPGLEARRPAAAAPAAHGLGGLFLAGDWTATGWPSTMEGAVRSGRAAAAAALGRR